MLKLVDMSHLNKCSSVVFRDLGISRAIIDAVTRYIRCITSVNVAFITNNRVTYDIWIENLPMFLDKNNSLGRTATRLV